MATSMQVLCPNGRRQNVKITPNTKLLQVLEEVCKKQNFLPTEEYALKHGRNQLDLSLSVRYANIPNNAKLELVKSDKPRADSEVTIALQLESGVRLQHSFNPGVSLWGILQHWEKQDESNIGLSTVKSEDTKQHPVCIYMREEVMGENALKSVTLRKLGLTSGKAIIRHTHRVIDPEILSKIETDIKLAEAKEAKLEAAAVQKQKSNVNAISRSVSSSSTASTPEVQDSNKSETETKSETPELKVGGDENRSRGLSQSTHSSESMGSYATAESVSCESMDTEESSSGAQISQGSLEGGHISGGTEIGIPGVQMFRPGDGVQLTQEQQQMVYELAQAMAPQIKGAKPKQRQPAPQPVFADFKFPESTKGKAVYKNELSEVNKEDFLPCDREVVVFNLDEPKQKETEQETEELPDDFFEVTENDIRKMMMDLQKKVEISSNQPLMTQAMRDAMKEDRMSKYDRTVIRFYFPSRVVVQAFFRPKETVHSLQKFVKEQLEDKSTPFYLYTTPPKNILKDTSQTLIQANLVPAAVVHFGSEVKKECYLHANLLSKISSYITADKLAIRSQPSSQNSDNTSSGVGSSSNNTAHKVPKRPKTSPPDQDAKKVPKWFKMGK